MQHKRDFPARIDDNVAIWTEFKELTLKYDCVSLGEGAPSHSPPHFLKEAMLKAMEEGHNQYSRVLGSPDLVKSIAAVYGPKLGRKINPMTEVLVSAGANSAINSVVFGLIDPKADDEVIVFEPAFPQYQDHIQMAGGIYKPVPLELVDGKWRFDSEKLRQALSPKTRILILNNAHNPTGKLFTRDELDSITAILKEFPRVIVLSDDVYEYLTFDGKKSTLFASIGDNYERTVSLFSGGKLFSATGWKVGWAVGPADIINVASVVSATTIYCVNAPAQIAMARCLGPTIEQTEYKNGLSYLESTRLDFQEVRDLILSELRKPFDLQVVPLECESSFFVMVDISACRDLIPARFKDSHDYETTGDPVSKNRVFLEGGRIPLDLAFCRWMAVERGVIMMPNSLFYNKASPYRLDTLVRLSICKGLEHTAKALSRFKGKMKTD